MKHSIGSPLSVATDLAEELNAGHKFFVTIFRDVRSKEPIRLEEWTLEELREAVVTTKGTTKTDLPLLKLARFGDQRSPAGSLRHDANVEAISGVEVDYDGEDVGFDEAVEELNAAGLRYVAFTTPSHTPERPRWRVILPASTTLPAAERSRLVARVNGVLGGILSSESFALSQIFYFGQTEQSVPLPEAVLDGDFIDLRDDLDAKAVGKVVNILRTGTAAALEAHFKRQVDWRMVYTCRNIDELKISSQLLFDKLQNDIARNGALAHRWNGGTDWLSDKTRSARDKSLVQIMRQMGYGPTEAIACAVAWGGSNPHLGRGLVDRDDRHRDLDLQRYWVRCWMRPDEDTIPTPVADLPSSQAPVRNTKGTFPDICRKPPGAVGDLVKFFSRAMMRDVPDELLVPMALAAVAHAAQNRFVAGSQTLLTGIQTYLVIVANTGVGKTELGKALTRLVEGSAAQKGIFEAMASGPALLSRFAKNAPGSPYGPTLLFLMDELGFKLQARTGRSSQSHTKDLIDEIMILYGKANSDHRGKGYADPKKDIEPLVHPNLSLVGFTTEGPLVEALTGADAAAGLINRFLLATISDVDMPQKLLSQIDQTTPPSLARFMRRIGDPEIEFLSGQEALTDELKALRAGLIGRDKVLPQTILLFDQQAEARVDEITLELNKVTHASDALVESIWGRARQHVIVVAAILVIGEIDTDAENRPVPRITKEHINWAWEFVKWSTYNWLTMFQGKISGSDEEAAMNAIKELLTSVADYAPGGRLAHKAAYGNAKNNSFICAQGWMPKSLIGRNLRGLTLDLRERALAALVANEEIERREIAPQDHGLGEGQQHGRNAIAYRLAPSG